MASLSSVPSVSDMAELRANGFGVPIIFSIDANRFAHVSSLHLCIRFSLHDASIRVEREIYDPLPLCCSLSCVRIPLLPTTDHLCGNSPLVDTGYTVSLYLGHTSPQKSAPLHSLLPPLLTPFPNFVLKLNQVFTLSYSFPIHPMVMIPLIPLLRSSHLRPLSVPPL